VGRISEAQARHLVCNELQQLFFLHLEFHTNVLIHAFFFRQVSGGDEDTGMGELQETKT
jgi:hypothetical protein